MKYRNLKNKEILSFKSFLKTEYISVRLQKRPSDKVCSDLISRLKNVLEKLQLSDRELEIVDREELKLKIATFYDKNHRCYSSAVCRYIEYLQLRKENEK